MTIVNLLTFKKRKNMKIYLSIVFAVALLFGFFQLSNNYVDKVGHNTALAQIACSGTCRTILDTNGVPHCVGVCSTGCTCPSVMTCGTQAVPSACVPIEAPPPGEGGCVWQPDNLACVGVCPGGSHCEGDAQTCGPCVPD